MVLLHDYILVIALIIYNTKSFDSETLGLFMLCEVHFTIHFFYVDKRQRFSKLTIAYSRIMTNLTGLYYMRNSIDLQDTKGNECET